MKALRVGARITIWRRRARVVRCYVESGVLVSITACIDSDNFWTRSTEHTVYPHSEGVNWARGWSSKAARALLVQIALTS